jgi:hypothetical protein
VALRSPHAASSGGRRTHLISDLSGLTDGFRYRNEWLASLTAYALPASFYAGDALGSFNSWMRLVSGVLSGFGAAWLFLPLVDREARRTAQLLHDKLARFYARNNLTFRADVE